MDDLISREAAIDAIVGTEPFVVEVDGKQYMGQLTNDAISALQQLPSAEPEAKPIEYRDCENAMLRMWMDNVVTDGEYNRIMDKLNAHWGMKNG